MIRVSIGDCLEIGWRDCQSFTNAALRDVETAAAVNIGWLARLCTENMETDGHNGN